MKTLSTYPTKILLGRNNNEPIYLTAPKWDCGWYWGFGYIGNNNCHYHIDGMEKGKNLYDAFKEHFGNTLTVRDSDLWTLAELFKTFYLLKETAEVLGRGSTHLSSNPCKDLIINKDETDRINSVVLPQVFEEIYKILIRNKDNDKLFKKLVSINLEGNTSKIVKFMNENGIKTDDLKSIEGLSKDDYYIIHSFYWKEYHATKNK